MGSKSVKFFAKVSVVSSLLLLTLMVTAAADAAVQVASNPVSFGQVKQGGIATAKFQLINTGTILLTIQFMEFSMPGMRANVPQKIPAGASTEIRVTWDTVGLIGEVKGEIILTLDDPVNPEIVLALSGMVIP